MIRTFLKDRIIVISTSQDEWGVLTETESAEQRVRVEDYNRLVMDSNGKEIYGSMKIIGMPNLAIKLGDKIRITKKMGTAVTSATKKYQVIQIHKAEGFRTTHTEVII